MKLIPHTYFFRFLFIFSFISICVWFGGKVFTNLQDNILLPSPSAQDCFLKKGQNNLGQCCNLLYDGDQEAVRIASNIHIQPNDSLLLNRLDDCRAFYEYFSSYRTFYEYSSYTETSRLVEESYTEKSRSPSSLTHKQKGLQSLAYAILAHRDLHHVAQLLRLIYRPEHFYCIHIDNKSIGLREKVDKLVRCLPKNVFVSPISYTVVWGGNGILHATLSCLRDLVDRKDWSYFINLSAQDFPLKTNFKLIRTLTSWNGRSSVEITGPAPAHKVKYKYETVYNRYGNADSMRRTGIIKDEPPYNVTIMKGNLAVVLTRELAMWFVTNEKAIEILDYLSDTANPDEYFWQTILFNRKNLGLHGRIFELTDSYHVRYAQWKGDKNECKGKYIRDVCVFGAGDLKRLINIPNYLFANKFYVGYQTPAYECMTHWHVIRSTIDQEQ